MFDEHTISNAVFSSSRYKFSGSFRGGRLSGKGRIELLDVKDMYEGEFKEGKLNGKCQIIDHKERHYSRYFINGRQVRDSKGLSDQEQEEILVQVESAYANNDYHSDVTMSKLKVMQASPLSWGRLTSSGSSSPSRLPSDRKSTWWSTPTPKCSS